MNEQTRLDVIQKHSKELSTRIANTIRFYIKDKIKKEDEPLLYAILNSCVTNCYIDFLHGFTTDVDQRIDLSEQHADYVTNLVRMLNEQEEGENNE